MRTVLASALVLSCLAGADLVTPVFANHQVAVVIERALIGAPPELAKGGTVLEQEADLFQESDNGWTRLPSPEVLQDIPPMCSDGVWRKWASAYLYIKDYAGATFGACYMLASDEEASLIDHYARGWSGS